MDRPTKKQQFIESYIQTWYNLEPMTGDASFRKYDRIKTPITTYVLMDSPPEHYSTEPFEQIAHWLLENNLSAPQIFHKDTANGFLLLEDFGDILLQHVLEENRKTHYMRAIDLLIELHKIQPPSWLPYYSNEMLLKEIEIFTDYYVALYSGAHRHPRVSAGRPRGPQDIGEMLDQASLMTPEIPEVASNSEDDAIRKQEYLAIWSRVLDRLPDLGLVMSLRDYHVQNLMHIEGVKSLGILDFQDAVIGSPIYDIVSILEDAREDVDFEFANEIFEYYLSQMPHINRDNARLAYDILGAQRNIRILGVFARKKIRDGSDNYLHLIPRVLNYVARDLTNPVLDEVREWHEKFC